MKVIQLTRGFETMVDDIDWIELSNHKWCCQSNGHGGYYAARRIGKKIVFMHRQILGISSDFCVDHKNGNPLDNRRINLRICNTKQNSQNSSKRSKYSGNRPTSIYKGVTWSKYHCRWQAQIKIDGKNKFLGRFDFEHEAAKAYNEAAREYFGEYSRLNIIFTEGI